MITIKRITNTDNDEYRYTETLLTASFPTDEYRALDEQRNNVEKNERFHFNIILDDNSPIGLISYWQFDGFIYIEHFATHPDCRGKGYGAAIITELIKEHPSIILEVELPTDEISERRIGFYRRCGLVLCTKEYIQPAYRPDSNELPMYLMSRGIDMGKEFERIKRTIHREVYGKH